MRPYLAVLKDSLREALASRILWLLTGLITLVLFVGLAPFTLREESAFRFQRNEFRDGPEFLKLLAAQETSRAPTAARRIWSRFPESLRHRLHVVSTENINEQAEILGAVRGELNGMLGSDELYDPTVWTPAMLSGEAQHLLDRGRGNLTYEEKRRLNRLLIDAAFPEHILPAPGKALYAAWFGYRLGAPLPFEPKQLTLLINFALFELTSFLAGILGVLIAILVTAPTVPQTFEPGAIDLLLSKPVSRSLLFLTKFFGASTFILLNAVYLIGGMWLIAGLRFDIWSGKLLLCIPVFLFLFVIYYSVSAFTGVIWRNAVVSVCCTVLFWGLCFAVGTAKNVAENTFLDPTRLAAIVPAGDKLLAVNRAGQTFEWSRDRGTWEEVFRGREEGGRAFFSRGSLIGPVYDAKLDRLCAVQSTRTRFEFFGGAGKLLVGPRREDWRRMESVVTPSEPQAVFADRQGQIILVTLYGVFRFEGNAAIEHRPFKIMGVDLAPHDHSGKFVRIGPPAMAKWQKPFSVAMNPADGALAVVSGRTLSLLVPGGTRDYALKRRVELGSARPADVVFVGSDVAVAQDDGRVRIFSIGSLAEQPSLRWPMHSRPRKITASPDGRWLAVLFDDRTVWFSSLTGAGPSSSRIAGQGDISAVAFSPSNQLLVADRFGRVTAYETKTLTRLESFEPSMDALEVLYRYLILPLYTVFPKPSELDAVVSYLVVGDPIDLFDRDRRLREELNVDNRPPVNLWRPIGSNLAFLAVMLTVTCIYIARRDF